MQAQRLGEVNRRYSEPADKPTSAWIWGRHAGTTSRAAGPVAPVLQMSVARGTFPGTAAEIWKGAAITAFKRNSLPSSPHSSSTLVEQRTMFTLTDDVHPYDQPQDTRSARTAACESSRSRYLARSCNAYLITLPAQGPYKEQHRAAIENVQHHWLQETRAPNIGPCEKEQLITAGAHSTLLNPCSCFPRGYRQERVFRWLEYLGSTGCCGLPAVPGLLCRSLLRPFSLICIFPVSLGSQEIHGRLHHLHPQHQQGGS